MMKKPQKYNRKSLRLKGYNYTQSGLYFVTICCQNRLHLFGEIPKDEMVLNETGQMIEEEWLTLPKRFPNIKLHEYIVMPNHFHAILEITTVRNSAEETLMVSSHSHDDVGQPQGIAPTLSPADGKISEWEKNPRLGDIVGAFQSITTVKYIQGVKTKGWAAFHKKVWQRNYWDVIIWNEKSYLNISKYILNNARNWREDKFGK